MNLGVFGGTFDPPHIGHLIVAQDAALALGLDRVLFVPAADPPHKRGRSITAGATRRAMLESALAGNDRFALEPLELDAALSYTVDTLRALRARLPDANLWLLIGFDQWVEFATWREPAAILDLARLAVIRRAMEDTAERAMPGVDMSRVDYIDATRIDVSSSEVRRRVGVGESIRYLVPDTVIEIIFREQLYRTATAERGGSAQRMGTAE